MDLLVIAGGLVGELVAGEVEDLEALVAALGIELLEVVVLRGEAATGRGVDDEQDLALVVVQADLLAAGLLDCVTVDVHDALLSRDPHGFLAFGTPCVLAKNNIEQNKIACNIKFEFANPRLFYLR